MTSLLKFPTKALRAARARSARVLQTGHRARETPASSRHSISCFDGHPVTGSCGGPRIATESRQGNPSGVTRICGSEARST
jgi:hypothetical protein